MKNFKFVIINCLLLVFLLTPPAFGSIILDDLQIPNSTPYRIIRNNANSDYWITTSAGLILLQEMTYNNWTYDLFPLPNIRDISEIDSQGYIYCTHYADGGNSGIYVFNTLSNPPICIADINLNFNRVVSGLTLSSDDTKLYVLGWEWPDYNQHFTQLEAGGHQNTGIIWKIDTQTFQIDPEIGVTLTQPETIYYGFNDKLYISSNMGTYYFVEGEYSYYLNSWNDIVLPVRGYPGQNRFAVGGSGEFFTNDFIRWTVDGSQVALLCDMLSGGWEDSIFTRSIWIIDSITDQVVDRIQVLDCEGEPINVRHAVVSDVNPGVVYISTGLGRSIYNDYTLAAIDYYTGEMLYVIDTPEGFTAQFIYEIPDGRLIVTGGQTGRILIIDPEISQNNPPVCSISADPVTYSGQNPIDIVFDASGSYDPDQGDVLTYSWDFNGDQIFGDPYDGGTDIQPVKIYSQDYEGTVSVRVTDNHNASATCTVTISVDITVNQPPVCSILAIPTTYVGQAPAVINFNASGSYDPDQGDYLTFSWDFNNDGIFGDPYDGGTPESVIKNFTADYNGPVWVRVTDNHGAYTDCSVVIMIDIT